MAITNTVEHKSSSQRKVLVDMLLRTVFHLKMNHLLRIDAVESLKFSRSSHFQTARPNQRIHHKLQPDQASTTNIVAASLHFFCLYFFCSVNSNYKCACCCLQAVQCLACLPACIIPGCCEHLVQRVHSPQASVSASIAALVLTALLLPDVLM